MKLVNQKVDHVIFNQSKQGINWKGIKQKIKQTYYMSQITKGEIVFAKWVNWRIFLQILIQNNSWSLIPKKF